MRHEQPKKVTNAAHSEKVRDLCTVPLQFFIMHISCYLLFLYCKLFTRSKVLIYLHVNVTCNLIDVKKKAEGFFKIASLVKKPRNGRPEKHAQNF